MSVTTKVQTDVINGDLEVNGDLTVTGEMRGDEISRMATVAEESRVVGVKVSNDVQSLLSSLASDDVLTPAEKKEVNRAWRVIYAEKPVLLTRASGYGYTAGNTYVDAVTTAYDALAAYLFTSPGPLNDLTTESSIDGTVMLGLFDDYYDAREDILAFLGALNGGNVSIVVDGAFLPNPGGICDGVDDNSEINSAIQAVNTAGGGTVHLAAATYHCSSPIVMRSNVTLAMEDGVILESSDVSGYIISSISGSENIKIIGGKIRRTSFTSLTYADVYLNQLANAQVINVSFDCGYQAIGSYKGTNIKIDRCYFELQDGTSVGWAIHIDQTSNVIVQNNTIQGKAADVDGALISVGNSTDGDVKINGNIISNITSNNQLSVISFLSQSGEITNNTIVNIRVAGDYSIFCISINNANDTAIAGNYIKNIFGEMDTAGIYILRSLRFTCSHNKIQDVAGNAILVDTSVYESSGEIKNNSCYNNGQLIDRGGCESTTPPMIFGETEPLSSGTGTYQRVADPYEGTYAWELISPGGGVFAWRRITDNITDGDMHGLIPGLEYTVTFWAKRTASMSADEARFTFQYQESGVFTETVVDINSDAWTEYTCTVTLPSTATGFSPYFIVLGTASSGEKLVIDYIRLYPTGKNNQHENQLKVVT